MKKNKISKNWINKQRRDIYVRQSKVEGYRARSVYKLIEIDEKFGIFKGGQNVIDIGAAPGSWSQYVSKVIKNGTLISVDLKKMEEIQNAIQLEGDFTDLNTQYKIKKYIKDEIDVVLSDMAVNTTGIKNVDAIQTGELCEEAMIFAKDLLTKKGKFISKIFILSEIISISSSSRFANIKVKNVKTNINLNFINFNYPHCTN